MIKTIRTTAGILLYMADRFRMEIARDTLFMLP